MSLFSARTFSHPNLGVLTYRSGTWYGQATVAPHGRVEVRVPGSRSEPDQVASGLVVECLQRYSQLVPLIEPHLFEHYQPYQEAFQAGEYQPDEPIPVLGGPSEIWSHVTSASFRAVPYGNANEVEIVYGVDWDEEHMPGALIRDWGLHGFSGSVR